MIYEITTPRKVTLDPHHALSVSDQARFSIVGLERGRGADVQRRKLQPGTTSVGPKLGSILYTAYVTQDQTHAALITSISEMPIATMKGICMVPSQEVAIAREEVEPGDYVPIGGERIAFWASVKARGIRRVIRTRHFLANIATDPGRESAQPGAPTAMTPLAN